MRFKSVTRWAGLVFCLALMLAFVVSLRRYVSWTSSDAQRGVSLMLGAISVVGPPQDWNLENDSFAVQPGWSIAEFGGSPRMVWWIERGSNPYGRWVTIPLWLPVVAVGIPIAWLWYHDRWHVRDSLRRWAERLRPPRRLKVTFWRMAAFTVIHGGLVILLLIGVVELNNFFHGNWSIDDWVVPVLFWAAPLWGILWAWLYVRFRNRLLAGREGAFCTECGYDLTGNVSGVCPECGICVSDVAVPRTAKSLGMRN